MAQSTTKKPKTTKRKSTVQQPAARTPVVAFLGHVDHGKTTILDNIRKSSIQAGEEGGITQGISVYSVTHAGRDITFIDTPGHEAFDLMRSRGGAAADIVLLIVAADDSVQPQTKESIEIILASQKPCIVVINKIDIDGVSISKVKRDLSTAGIQVESVGGKVPCVEVSGKTGKGIPELLEMIQLVADVSQISQKLPRAGTLGEAVVLESLKDKCKGHVSTVVVTAGELRRGSFICYRLENSDEIITERIKGFSCEDDSTKGSIPQGYGGEIIGLGNLVPLGTIVYCSAEVVPDAQRLFDAPVEQGQEQPVEKSAGEEGTEGLAHEAGSAESPTETTVTTGVEWGTSEQLASMLDVQESEAGKQKTLKVIIKSNAQGTLDAIMKSLSGEVEEGLIEVALADAGNITVGDINLAINVHAIVLGFRVAIDPVAAELARKNRILAKVYQIIYELVDEVEDAAATLQLPETVEEQLGDANIKKIFVLSNNSKVLGMRVEHGEIKQGAMCRIMRNKAIVAQGKIVSMRSEKETVHVAGKGSECGVVLDVPVEAEEGDLVQCYRIVKA